MAQPRLLADGMTDLAGRVGRKGPAAFRNPGAARTAPVALETVLWSIIGAIVAVDLGWSAAAGLSIGGWWRPVLAAAALLFIAWLYQHRSRILADTARMGSLWICFTAAGCVLTYLAATCARPLQDGVLAGLDRALGFDWLAWHDAVAAHRVLYAGLFLAYASLMVQTVGSVLILPALGKTGRCAELILLAALTLAPTTLISAVWPVLGPFAVFGGDNADFLPHLIGLRNPGPWHFDLVTMQGIVQMPSYHMVMAVLFTYTYRDTGLIGWAVAIINGVMLLSIPSIGGHYLVDIIVGAAITVVCIVAWRGVAVTRVFKMLAQSPNQHA